MVFVLTPRPSRLVSSRPVPSRFDVPGDCRDMVSVGSYTGDLTSHTDPFLIRPNKIVSETNLFRDYSHSPSEPGSVPSGYSDRTQNTKTPPPRRNEKVDVHHECLSDTGSR